MDSAHTRTRFAESSQRPGSSIENAMTDSQNNRTVKNATQARAGFWDRPVAVVLSISLGLVIVLFVVVYLMFFGRP